MWLKSVSIFSTSIMTKILNEKIVFTDKLVIEKGELSDGKKTFSRLRINRPDACVVFILNTETQKVILIKQFRYAIASKTSAPIYEIVAGKLDHGEKPLGAAIRETEEETGYRISPSNIQFLISCFVSPGYTSEKFHLYYATVTNEDKKSKGGGLENENESIEVIEMDRKDFYNLIDEGKIEDAKTYLAALMARKMILDAK
jgi:nudix-type nucleoside diphosphatase (YffH/AdpP family)